MKNKQYAEPTPCCLPLSSYLPPAALTPLHSHLQHFACSSLSSSLLCLALVFVAIQDELQRFVPSCAERCRGSWWSGSVVQRILCSFALCKCRIIAAVKDAMPHQSDMHCNRSETPSEVPRSKALPSAAFIPLSFFSVPYLLSGSVVGAFVHKTLP